MSDAISDIAKVLKHHFVFINCKLLIKFLEYLNAWPPVKQLLFNGGATMPKKLRKKMEKNEICYFLSADFDPLDINAAA